MSNNNQSSKPNNDIHQHTKPKTTRQTSGNTMTDTSASRDRVAKLQSMKHKDKKPKSFIASPLINIPNRNRFYSLPTNPTEIQKMNQKLKQKQSQYPEINQGEHSDIKTNNPAAITTPNNRENAISQKRVKYKLYDHKGTKYFFELFKWLQPIKILGAGAYAVVCEVINTKTKQKYAIKKNENVFVHVIEAQRILREIKLMRHFNHPNIMNLYDVIPPEKQNEYQFNECYLIIPCMDITLKKVIRSKQKLTERHKIWIMYQITRGLEYMHSGGIIHRDIKPDNILLNAADCSLKITDFGLSRGINNSMENNYCSKLLTEYVVTRWYRAPEIMCCSGIYDCKIDIWAMGCIAAELYTRNPIFKGRNYFEQMQLYLQWIGTTNDLGWITNLDAANWIKSIPFQKACDLKQLLPNSNEIARDFIKGILILNPYKRPDATNILKHEWMKEYFKEGDYKRCELFSMEYENDKALKHIFGVRHRIYNELYDIHNSCGVYNNFGSSSKQSCV